MIQKAPVVREDLGEEDLVPEEEAEVEKSSATHVVRLDTSLGIVQGTKQQLKEVSMLRKLEKNQIRR